MARVKFKEGNQRSFLEDVLNLKRFNSKQLAKICNISDRTFRDWKREKYLMSYNALLKICKIFKLSVPNDIEVLDNFWSARQQASIGGKRRCELYGPPGNIESRRKGGINSAKVLLANPELAERQGLSIRKKITYPKIQKLLAEFLGILFGDGGVNYYQVVIYFNKSLDKEYANYLVRIINKLFSIESSIYHRKEENTGRVIVSSRNLVEFLEQYGIKAGNKTGWNNKLPEWIWQKKEFQSAFLRGFMDTDGCVFRHKYKVNGKRYSFVKISFTSYSKELRRTITQILRNLNFIPKEYGNRVFLYRKDEVNRYFKEVETHNPRYLARYKRFVSS